jgi:hypothetical protein
LTLTEKELLAPKLSRPKFALINPKGLKLAKYTLHMELKHTDRDR